jgi:hypothetical protein
VKMAKAKKGTAKKNVARTASVAKKPEEMQKVRNQVANVIVDGSVEMAKRVVRSVSEEGNINALKFLWEFANLFPTPETEEDPEEQETLAKILLKGLRLPAELPSEEKEPGGNVELEELEELEEIAEVTSGLQRSEVRLQR